jgi:hypothetical protein
MLTLLIIIVYSYSNVNSLVDAEWEGRLRSYAAEAVLNFLLAELQNLSYSKR